MIELATKKKEKKKKKKKAKKEGIKLDTVEKKK